MDLDVERHSSLPWHRANQTGPEMFDEKRNEMRESERLLGFEKKWKKMKKN
jgi:hypothetical protein